jgi:hypothetical protein
VPVGCVAKKHTEGAPAKDLYRSRLWRGRRRYAESTGVPWFILSALQGLVEPDQHLDPYNVALTDLSASERRECGERVVADLAGPFALAGAVLEVHAGSAYRNAIQEPLRRNGAEISVPLTGLKQRPPCNRDAVWSAGLNRGERGPRCRRLPAAAGPRDLPPARSKRRPQPALSTGAHAEE